MRRQSLIVIAIAVAVMLGAGSAPADASLSSLMSRAKARFATKAPTTTTTVPRSTTTVPKTSTTTTTTVPKPKTTTTTATTASNANSNASASSPLPVSQTRLTKLRFTIDSTSQWATVDLLGGSIYDLSTPTVTGGPGGNYSSTGFFLQTTSAGRLVVDVVYSLPVNPLELRVCKNNNGMTSVRVERITDAPTTVAMLTSIRNDGVWDNGCADAARANISPNTLAPSYAWPRLVDNRRLTLALYTPWYTPSTFVQQLFVDKPVTPYDASTQDGVNGMVRQAAANGVNGFLYWYNGDPEAMRRYDLVMQAAEAQPGFSVAAELDIGALGGFDDRPINAGTVESWTRQLLARASSPSYLRVNGRPVLFVWGTWWLPTSVWSQVMQSLRASGVNPFVVADGIDPAFGFDGYWVLNPNNLPNTAALPGWYDALSHAARVSADRQFGATPLLWAAGISPGEDDTFSGKLLSDRWYIDRDNGSRYDRAWQAAAASRPDWMVISTWNDFHEATYIQPSEKLGAKALDQTRSWAGWFVRS